MNLIEFVASVLIGTFSPSSVTIEIQNETFDDDQIVTCVKYCIDWPCIVRNA